MKMTGNEPVRQFSLSLYKVFCLLITKNERINAAVNVKLFMWVNKKKYVYIFILCFCAATHWNGCVCVCGEVILSF